MKNENNVLGITQGDWGLVLVLVEKMTVFVPCVESLANARVVGVNADGSLSVHWKSQYNLDGEHATELMQFNNDLFIDKKNQQRRNAVRKAFGQAIAI